MPLVCKKFQEHRCIDSRKKVNQIANKYGIKEKKGKNEFEEYST